MEAHAPTTRVRTNPEHAHRSSRTPVCHRGDPTQRFQYDRPTTATRVDRTRRVLWKPPVIPVRALRNPLKRLTDITGALTALILLAPVLVGLWVTVRIKLGAPVLFIQQRPGKDG